MQGYILKIAYKGTSLCGWQVQPNKPTVQAIVQKACEEAFGVSVTLTGCSRTDSGVHAKGFIALLCGDIPDISPASLPLAINTKLPECISVTEANYAPENFHPRYDAKGKEYVYRVRNSRIRDPFTDDFEWLYPKHIDENYANELCKELVGKKDFCAFMASGSKIIDTVREIKYFNAKREGDCIIFTVAADGFLYNMVRIMVGTLLKIQQGKLSENSIPYIIKAENRKEAGPTAPACGLYLDEVFY